MSLAKDVAPATLGFLLAQTGTISRRDALLACVAATAADGSFKATRSILLYALQGGVSERELREAILELAPLAGAARADAALLALAQAHDESKQPSDPFAAMLAPERPNEPASQLPEAEDEQPADSARALALLEAVHGERARAVRERIARRSKALARWVEEDLYGRVFSRAGLERGQRVLVAVGALYPLDARALLEEFARAALLHGANAASLWTLAELLSRLFQEAPEIRNAKAAFEAAIGKKPRSEEPSGGEMRWD